jgi:hypothetical protein
VADVVACEVRELAHRWQQPNARRAKHRGVRSISAAAQPQLLLQNNHVLVLMFKDKKQVLPNEKRTCLFGTKT